MEMDRLRSEAFNLLQPVCVQLTREHTRGNVCMLFNALRLLDITVLQDLQEYVLFPLRIILKQPQRRSQDLYLDVYTCMEYILGHTKVTRWQMFFDMFTTATSMLSCPIDGSKVAKLSEELKIAIIQTLRTLVGSCDHSVSQQLYTVDCLPLLGHAVSLLLNIADGERARNLRILALECLLDLSQADSKCASCVKVDVGNTFSSFLPGVSMTLCRLITGDTKQGFAVTTKALYVWMRIVSLVMDDKLLDLCRQKQAASQDKANKVNSRLQPLVVTRGVEWVGDTAANLAMLVRQLTTVRSHGNWRVRLGLVECAEHLLLHCTRSMKDSVPVFLEILVAMIGDDYGPVAQGSRHALQLFSESEAPDQQRQLVEILEDNLHRLATCLPRQIQTAEEEDKLSLLNLLSGYISLLGSKVKSLLLSLPHLRRLAMALVHMLELECGDIKVVEERTQITGHGSSAISSEGTHGIIRPRKYFKHFNNELIFTKIQGVCRLLGYFGDINLLVDHFLELQRSSSMFRLQATLIINELMLGTTGDDVHTAIPSLRVGVKWRHHSRDELDTVVRMLVDEYLCPENFDLPTCMPTDNHDQSLEQQLGNLAVTNTSSGFPRLAVPDNSHGNGNTLTAAKMNRNIVQISLLMEGIADFSKVLQRDFRPLLMHVLYPLLVKLGDSSAYISSAAFVALSDICESCGYRSLDELIRDNTDYVVDAISLRLRHLQENQTCPLVMKVMLQYGSSELLPLVDGTIQELLACLDDHHDEASLLFMGVLSELVKAIVRWFPPEPESTTEHHENSPSDGLPDGERLKHYFANLIKLQHQSEGEITQEDLDNFTPDVDDTGQEDPVESDQKSIPKHVAQVKEVMLRCKHVLSSSNLRLRLLALDTIGQACIALQPHQDELLPLIHQVWPSFSLRFTDEHKQITIKALDTLHTMATVSGDFIKHRVTKDVLPKLAAFMRSQAEISVTAGSAYQFTVNYKLQLAVLKHAGFIANTCRIDGNDLDQLASVCVLYLNDKQPPALQTACIECCGQLIEIDRDLLWLKLCDLHCPVTYTPPDNRFLQVKVLQQPGPPSEYTTNVTSLMESANIL